MTPEQIVDRVRLIKEHTKANQTIEALWESVDFIEKLVMFVAEQQRQLDGVRAALTDESLTPSVKVHAAMTYIGTLMMPTDDDIQWALAVIKRNSKGLP